MDAQKYRKNELLIHQHILWLLISQNYQCHIQKASQNYLQQFHLIYMSSSVFLRAITALIMSEVERELKPLFSTYRFYVEKS